MGNQARLVKRLEALERKVEAINQAAASGAIVEALMELAGGEKAVQAKVAELTEKRRLAAEAEAAEAVTRLVAEEKLAMVEAVTDKSFVVARTAEGHRADAVVRMMQPKAREEWLGKKVGDVVQGLTVAEVYDLQPPKPRAPPASVETASEALAAGKEG